MPVHKTVTGVAESIDEQSNQVSMRWYNDRKQREEIIKGVVTDQTEVLINGCVARLVDIRVGERVKVTGRIMKEPDEGPYIATRIEVTRPDADTMPSSRSTTTRSANP